MLCAPMIETIRKRVRRSGRRGRLGLFRLDGRTQAPVARSQGAAHLRAASRSVAHRRAPSRTVKVVSSCDKLNNARTIVADLERHGDSVWERFAGGKEGTQWYCRALADFFRRFRGRTVRQ
jgi:hypothetical protein